MGEAAAGITLLGRNSFIPSLPVRGSMDQRRQAYLVSNVNSAHCLMCGRGPVT